MDIQYLLLLQNLREATGGILNSFFLGITALGEQPFTFLLLAFIYWCVDKRAGQRMALNVSVACTLNQFVKWKCRVERPWIRDGRILPVSQALSGAGGYSFPSGHTQRAAAVWGALGAFCLKGKERLIAGACFLTLALISFSRNFLGVHTPQDVLVALAAGAVLIFLIEKLLCWAEGGKDRDLVLAAAGCAVCFLPMLWAGCLSNAGAGMGLWIGWVLERRFVSFQDEGTWPEKIMRFFMGGMGVLFLQQVLPAALRLMMEAKYAGFFTSFCLAVFIMAGYPFFFSRRERYKAGILLAACGILTVLVFSGWQTRRIHAAAQTAETADTVKEAAKTQEAQTQEPVQEAAESEAPSSEDKTDVLLPAIIAHRGYSSQFPENTLASFEGAFDIGADYIELDVQMTRDGEAVVFHDDSLSRITGAEGTIADYTYEELLLLDAGSWFDASFAGERIPTLDQALDLTAGHGGRIYLELKDMGERPGFEEAVLEAVAERGMTAQCIFASFNYSYLTHLKELDASLQILYNTTGADPGVVSEYPADYYGFYLEAVTPSMIEAAHRAGSQAFVWTANEPASMTALRDMGADGIVTNHPGLAKVILRPEYSYLAENFQGSVTLPGLYGGNLPENCGDFVVQGFTKAGTVLAVSAYSKSGEYNSVLFLMNMQGKLLRIVDLGFKAHTGGISYDGAHDLIWVTGPEGMVYALSWKDILEETYQGESQISFDAGLVNHNGSRVASFLTCDGADLYVGSYVDGAAGVLNRYDISDPGSPVLLSAVSIPQRIQGITFKTDAPSGVKYMLLSQGYQTQDSCLLSFVYDEQTAEYAQPMESRTLPEGVEQIQMTGRGMYILFESAARPYRATARIPNDQIYLVRE